MCSFVAPAKEAKHAKDNLKNLTVEVERRKLLRFLDSTLLMKIVDCILILKNASK